MSTQIAEEHLKGKVQPEPKRGLWAFIRRSISKAIHQHNESHQDVEAIGNRSNYWEQ